MKNRMFITAIVIMAMLIGMIPVAQPALADSEGNFTSNPLASGSVPSDLITGSFTYALNIGNPATVTIAEYIGTDLNVVIPDNLNGIPVTGIGYEAFYNWTALNSITIPSSVTNIGDDAFYNCYKLTSITIPSGVTSIGKYAFYNWTALNSITIPSSVTNIGDDAFNNCSNLTYAYFAGNTPTMGVDVFSGVPAGFVIYYQPVSTGFTTPTWKGYASIEAAPLIIISTPSSGEAGTPYNYVFTATGGVGTKSYAVTSGVLPTGLSLSSTGILSGTPTSRGASSFTVTVTDSINESGSVALSVTINPAPVLGGGGGATSASQTTTPTFSDVPTSYWAYDTIGSLSSKGIVSGYPDGTFKPDAAITRSEFTTMLVNALVRNTVGTSGQFTDVTAGSWCYSSVDAAVYAGLVSGMGDHLFAPSDPITREQMAVMVAHALGTNAPAVDGTELNAFSDRSAVSSWAVTGMEEAVRAGIVSGMATGRLAPNDNATRAQAAAMIYKLLTVLGK